ncbi:MAG: spore germination protein [Clostridia bacterium]|nr:spore germination protein [Clostridia bacterium]
MSETPWEPFRSGVITEDFAQSLSLLRKASHAEESEDVALREFTALGHAAALLYVDGLTDGENVQRFLLEPLLHALPPQEDEPLDQYLMRYVLPLASVSSTTHVSQVLNRVFSGDAALIMDTMQGALIADMKGFVKRSVSEPINESVVAGPHEGFTESLRDNTVLIRRLLRTPALVCEAMTVGNKVPSRICLMYLDGIARGENVEEIKRRLDGCNIDYVSSIGMLEQLIEDAPFALLPQTASTERPDRAVGFLTEGQIIILMENAPEALAMPVGFLHLFHAPDDTAMRWQYGTFLRLLRLSGILISLLLPALFIALTVYHPEGLSLSLMTSVVESQAKVPLSLLPSMLIMLLIFSLINEAGTRVPGALGASLSIVGGLILGQAVVEAELFSPLILIVVALSGLGSYAAPTFPLTLALRIGQLILLLAAGAGGYPGMTLALFCLLLRAFGVTSLKSPYFSPVAPKRPANPDRALRLPIWRQRLRGAIANPFHMNRAWGAMRAWEQPDKEKP